MLSAIHLALTVIALAAHTTSAGVALTLTNIELTVYYDNTVGLGQQGQCAITHGWAAGWQDGVLKDPGSCGGRSIMASANNRMIALPHQVNPKQFCGHKVRIIDSNGVILKADGQEYFYVKDTLPSSTTRVDISAQAMIAYGNRICGVSPQPGAVNMPNGFTVEVLDEMDPSGSALSDFVETASPAGGQPASPSNSPVVSGQSGQCTCTQAQLGQSGCCNGQAAICDWISNEPKLLAFKIVGGACSAKRSRNRRV